MKRSIIFIILIIGIGAVVMAGYQNFSRLNYIRYSPKDTLINVDFEYPEGWAVFERRGAYGAFIQAQILEDLDLEEKKNNKACNIVVTIYPESKVQFTPLTTQGCAEDIKKKRLTLKGSELISSSNMSIAGVEATDDKLAYEIFDVPLKANAQPIPIIERIVCFRKADNFYVIRLEIGRDRFEPYNKIFNRVLKSIRFSQ